MPRYYSNGLEVPEPKQHKDVPVKAALDAFALLQDRGIKNYESQQKKPKQKVTQMWLPEDLAD